LNNLPPNVHGLRQLVVSFYSRVLILCMEKSEKLKKAKVL
jgi:hypothetical protein